MTSGRLAGKVAMITGAARGIGLACACRFAQEGADIALLDIARDVETVGYRGAREAQLDEAASQVRRLGGRAARFMADVRDGEALRRATAETVSRLGALDILVAAAGIDSRGSAWELTDEQWQTMLDINLTGVWQSAKAVTPHMLDRGGGSIVFIGSVLSHKHYPGSAHYTAAKHGVLGLTRAFALELAPHLIRVNSVAPTAVATDMALNQPLNQPSPDAVEDEAADSLEERLLAWNAMPLAMIEPLDVANAALFLASDEARFVTGVSLPVDLGSILK